MVIPLLKKFVGFLFLFLVNFAAAQAGASADSSKWINRKIKIANDSVETPSEKSFNSRVDSSNPVLSSSVPPDHFYEDGLILHNNDSIRVIIDKASAVLEKIKKTQNFITTLNSTTGFELPVGISKTIGGLNYDIGIQAIRLKSTYAELDAYMQFEVPQNGKKLTFMARGIKFSKAGAIIGDAKLVLVGDYAINLNGDKSQLVLKGALGGTGGTFVRMDCDGFREMGLDAEVRFSRDVLLPEDATKGVLPTGNVVGSFQATISNWNDLLVQISLPNFQVAGLTGFGFSIEDAVFDFSDVRNAPSVVFPKGYSIETDPALVNLWRGVYVRKLSIRLPPHFKDKKSLSTSLTASDLLVDHQGVSGMFLGRNLIPLNNGDMNGWAFSVDSLAVSLMANQIQQAGFKGNIVIPVSEKQNAFKYTASFGSDNQYFFSVAPTKNMQFKLWQTSKVEIYKASRLEMAMVGGRFLPKAILNGQMSISAKLSEGGKGVEIADVKFENLQIQSVKPFISVGSFSFGSEAAQQKLAGFPVSIKEIGMNQISDRVTGLEFSLLLNLTSESSSAFAADAGLTLIGSLESDGGSQAWKFKDIEIRSIKVDINGGAFKFNGSLNFYRNDVTYGDGFNGAVKAEFIPNIKVNASAIFGNVNGHRYWYADALASFKPGILIFPGVAFYGFGGGAYEHMKMAESGNSSDLGKTPSGIVYVPDQKAGLGIKAIFNFGSSPSDLAFNGDVTFEVAFFNTGGLRTISMTGNAFIATPKLDGQMEKLMASAKKMARSFEALEANAKAKTGVASKISNQESMIKSIHGDIGKAAGARGAISAHAFVQYDFENSELHGNFNVTIDLAAGLLQGHGDAVLHFAPHEWYVYVGTPDSRITLSMGIGPIRATTSSYFMVGSKIPGSPPPPDEVSKILGGMDLDYMKDLNTIASGGGFAFGSAFDVNTGDVTFLMFYAHFHAGAGFDIMLKDYGDTYCEGNNSRIGVNGWYANGQAYAFFEGDIGIRVKIFGRRKNVQILSVGAAAVLQAQLPNPIWLRGVVGGYFSVLGGLVSGSCRFEVTIGSQCKLIKKTDDNALDGISVISQLTPSTGEKDINVFNIPQVVFSMPVEKTFELEDNGVKRSFRVKLDYFKLNAGGSDLAGNLEWNDSHDVVAFNSLEVLPPKKELRSSVQVSFEELKDGSWIKVLENGQPFIEKSEVRFTTGNAPDYIPYSNVYYTYPVSGQLNFYKDETSEGYIKLKKGQGYLFAPDPQWRQTGRFIASNGSKAECGVSYSNQTISFVIPSSRISPNAAYAFELLSVPTSKSESVDRNVTEAQRRLVSDNASVDLEIKQRTAQGSIEELQEKSLYSFNFKSSSHNTFSSKINSLSITMTGDYLGTDPYDQKVFSRLSGPEYFDKIELEGSNFTVNEPLVLVETDLSENTYYQNKVYPLVYQGYPFDPNISISYRTPDKLGVPPFKACNINQLPSSLVFDNSGTASTQTGITKCEYIFDLPKFMHNDFTDIQTKVVKNYLNMSNPPTRMITIMSRNFPRIEGMTITYKLNYVMPGTQKITSSRILKVNY